MNWYFPKTKHGFPWNDCWFRAHFHLDSNWFNSLLLSVPHQLLLQGCFETRRAYRARIARVSFPVTASVTLPSRPGFDYSKDVTSFWTLRGYHWELMLGSWCPTFLYLFRMIMIHMIHLKKWLEHQEIGLGNSLDQLSCGVLMKISYHTLKTG